MADEKDELPPSLRYPPGILVCNRAIKHISHFRALVVNDQRWGPYIQGAPDLATVLPKGTPKDRQHSVLEQEINKAIPFTFIYLKRAGVPCDIQWTDKREEWDYDKKDVRPRNEKIYANLVSDYYRVKAHDKNAQMFGMLIGALDQGIGYYEGMRTAAIRRKLRPLNWVGFLLSIPVRALIDAGLVSPFRDKDDTLLKWILGGVQTLWVGMLTYAGKLVVDHHLVERVWHFVFR